MTNSVCARFFVFVYLLLLPAYASAEERQAQVFPLPNHGRLHLPVPQGWRSNVMQPPESLPPTIEFTPAAGSGFKLLVTPVWPVGQGVRLGPENARKVAEKAADRAREESVEQQLPLKDLKGPSTAGYYFSATDRAPKPGEYRYLTQGAFVLGDLLVTFTALTKDGSEDATREALAAMAGATYDASGPALPGASAPRSGEAVKVTKRKVDYLVTHPRSALTLRIPKGGLQFEAGRGEGMNKSPLYFFFEDPASHLILSGWMEPEQRFGSLAKQWLDDTRAWKEQGLPEPGELSFGWLRGWETVYYDINLPGSISSHARAHWIQAGTWVDLHLSITGNEPSGALRSRLKTLLQSIEVKERK